MSSLKLGNISQTVVPVPSFFLNRGTKNIDAFNVPKRAHSYYREKDLFQKELDLNLNRNQRFSKKENDESNKEKYIPVYNLRKYPNNAELNHTYFPNIIDTSKGKTIYPKTEYQKFLKYKNSSDYLNFFAPNLREEIMHNTKNLLDRINVNYDLDRWSNFDSKITTNRFYQTAYSPITDVLNTDGNSKDKFSQTLREKAMGLRTINSRAKESLNSTIARKQKLEEIEQKNSELIAKKENLNLDDMLESCKDNLLNLKYNNFPPYNYTEYDQKFIYDNDYITKSINNGELYKDFPSKTRMEFDVKKIIVPRKKNKISYVPNLVKKDKYNYNEKALFNVQPEMWIRPLHKDAYELTE